MARIPLHNLFKEMGLEFGSKEKLEESLKKLSESDESQEKTFAGPGEDDDKRLDKINYTLTHPEEFLKN